MLAKMTKKSTIIKNYQSNTNSLNSSSLTHGTSSMNDALVVVGLAHNVILPFCYSNKSGTEIEKVEKHIKTISDIASNISEHAKPYLTKYNHQHPGETGHHCHFALATNDGNLLTMKAIQTSIQTKDENLDLQSMIRGADSVHLDKKLALSYPTPFSSISSETITIKVKDLDREDTL